MALKVMRVLKDKWGSISGDINDQTDLMDELDKKVITLTKAQYEALPAADKLDPSKVYYVPDDESEYNANELDDTVTASDKVWSSQKVSTELAKKYDENDTAETDIQDTDYVPFYDTSATGKRKSLWSNIKAKLKAYFDGIYTLLTIVGTVESGTTASKRYEIGNHFIKDGYFCTAIAVIASGATLTLNTNYTRGDIANACAATVARTGSYNDLKDKPKETWENITGLPTKLVAKKNATSGLVYVSYENGGSTTINNIALPTPLGSMFTISPLFTDNSGTRTITGYIQFYNGNWSKVGSGYGGFTYPIAI